jgi:carboxyvinyl-carboxyphosphonate phosphorylmutase
MTVAKARIAFRALLAGERAISPASVYDAISARAAQDLGFEAMMLAGSVASLAVLGAPDLIVLTLSEFADLARRITRAAALPLFVDADHGYGTALNVKRTVEELEAAGVSGLSIEDTELPPPFGGGPPRLIPIAEGVGKMKAALAGKSDPNLVVAGRTSVNATTIEDAADRVKAYADAGVDAAFVVGTKSLGELDAVAKAAGTLPLIIGGGSGNYPAAELAARRIKVLVPTHLPFAAAAEAARATLAEQRKGTPNGEIKGAPSAETMKMLTRDADYRRWMKDFLS